MLKNFWYVAEESANIQASPTRVTLLGQQFVLFRDSRGQVQALSDVCIHRGGSLAGGTVEGDCVRCPYHGWRFDGTGACVEIPANAPGTPVPRRARVDAYPAQEHYGWVWVFLGDLPESERPPIPPLPEFAEAGWRPVYGTFRWKAHYTRVVENAVDIAHTPFVHARSFGNPNDPWIRDYDVLADDHSVAMSTTLRSPDPKGLWKYLRRGKRPDVKAATAVYMPNVTRLDIDLGLFRFVILGAHLPVDDATTLTRWVMLRNFFTGAWADRDSRKRALAIFLEDQATVEAQRPERLPDELGAELHVRSDAIQIAFRKMRRRFLERGWGIDRPLIRSELEGRAAVVIPSPARRANPELEGAWVLHEVPTVPPSDPTRGER